MKIFEFHTNILEICSIILCDILPALVQILVWRRTGTKLYLSQWYLSLLTYICVTRPRRVDDHRPCMSFTYCFLLQSDQAGWTCRSDYMADMNVRARQIASFLTEITYCICSMCNHIAIKKIFMHMCIPRCTVTYGELIETRYVITILQQQYHYNDVIMGAMASQITSLTIVYSAVCSDQRKHQSSASPAFVRGNSPMNGECPAQSASNADKTRSIFFKNLTIDIP